MKARIALLYYVALRMLRHVAICRHILFDATPFHYAVTIYAAMIRVVAAMRCHARHTLRMLRCLLRYDTLAAGC